jgi:CBS domain-containing protein
MLVARDIMNPNIASLGENATVEEAIDLLVARELSGVPVLDEFGHVRGIITEFALLEIAYDKTLRLCPVAALMTKDVITVQEDETLNRIADLFILHRIQRLPVVRNGKLVGMISRRDLLRAFHEERRSVAV